MEQLDTTTVIELRFLTWEWIASFGGQKRDAIETKLTSQNSNDILHANFIPSIIDFYTLSIEIQSSDRATPNVSWELVSGITCSVIC